MVRLTEERLRRLAKGFRVGGTASFTSKENATRFRKIIGKKGFKTGVIRSSGPTVEGDRFKKAHTVILTKKIRVKPVRRVTRRRMRTTSFSSEFFGIGSPNF